MITETKIILYRANCDYCGDVLEKKFMDIAVFDLDEDELYEMIEDKKWKQKGDNIYCRKCIDANA